jgi:hydroxymethylpyrimidine/phosphomethylpyrimidine kinase
MGFFQKGRKRINQKNGTTCAFSPAITGHLDTPLVEQSYPAQTSVVALSQFDNTAVSE